MSCELETSITIRGTQVQLVAMLKVLQTFENAEEYKAWDLFFHVWETVNGKPKRASLSAMTEQDLTRLAAGSDGSLSLFADGPRGDAYDTEPFEQLAQAVPDGEFSGRIEGIWAGEDILHTAEYADGHLELYQRSQEDYMWENYGIDDSEYC
jgi:hypothetical protein